MSLQERFDVETAEALLEWFREYGVAYPWAGSTDAWGIWVSEVMLQQTTVGAVEPRYRRWMERFPTPKALAEAEEEEILREWEGLGYYNRARNLASAAAEIQNTYGGKIPQEPGELRKLPGIGEYIAAALSSFAFGKREAALDANGRRIAQRLEAQDVWDKTLEDDFKRTIVERMPAENPGEMNAAIMQLGQLVCTSRSPDCGCCPFSAICRAFAEGLQDCIPLRRRQKVIQKETKLAILQDGEKILLMKKADGIGKGLWIFPSQGEIGNLEFDWIAGEELPRQTHSYTRYRELLLPRLFRRKEGSDNRSGAESVNLKGAGVKSLSIQKAEFFSVEKLFELPMPTAYRRITEDLVNVLKKTKSKELYSLESYS